MDLLSLKPIHMTSEFWTDFLTTQLTTQVKQIAHANPTHSHNIDKSRQLHEHGGYHNRKPFYRRFLNAKHVLKLRLQMAPLATHMYDDASALPTMLSNPQHHATLAMVLQCTQHATTHTN